MPQGVTRNKGLTLNVPLYGESVIEQRNAAADIITLKGAASATGDYLNGVDSSDNEDFSIMQDGQAIFGRFSSTAVGGVPLDISIKTYGVRVCADDGGVAIGAGVVRALHGRMMILTAIGATDTSVFGVQGHTKVAAVTVAGTAQIAGVWAYLETVSGSAVSQAAGLYAMYDLVSGATQSTGTVGAGVLIGSNSLAGTHTGKVAAIHVPNPVTGTWDFFAIFGDTTGCFSGATTRGADSNNLLVRIGATTFKIPVYANS
jgi:hypothetical protein